MGEGLLYDTAVYIDEYFKYSDHIWARAYLNTNMKCIKDIAQRLARNYMNKFMASVLNVTFNNMSVLLAEETGVLEENHRPVANHWQTLSHNVVSSTPGHERDSNSQL